MLKWIGAAMLLLAVLRPAVAGDRDKLFGIWKLVSGEVEFKDTGEHRSMYGVTPPGYLSLSREGRMMAVIEGDTRKPSQIENAGPTGYQNMVAYSGPFRVEGDKWITKVDTSWNPAWRGTDQVRFFKLEGNRLSVVSAWQSEIYRGGRVGRVHLTWERWKSE
jgi:Lipocalin-like domain